MFGSLNPQAASFFKPTGVPHSTPGANNWFTNPMNFFAANTAPTASLAAQFSPFSGLVPDPALIASKLDAVNASMGSSLHQQQQQQNQQNLFTANNSTMMNTNTSAASVITSIANAQNAASFLPAFYGNLMAGQSMYNSSAMGGNNHSQILQAGNMQSSGNRLQNNTHNAMQQQQNNNSIQNQQHNHSNSGINCGQNMIKMKLEGNQNGLGQVQENMGSLLGMQNHPAVSNATSNNQLKNPLSYILAPVQSNP